MVTGLNIFAKAFANVSDCYVIIGGTACDLVLTGTDMRPRATNDIDILLIVEKMSSDFGLTFWQFIRTGGYKRGSRKKPLSDLPRYVLYSFDSPVNPSFPAKLELLSRHSDALGEPQAHHLEPLPFEEGVSSLSIILVDEALYTITISENKIIQGVRTATPTALICLKIKAYRNLLKDKENGRRINSDDIKKHRNDVLKLVATTAFTEPMSVPKSIMDDIDWYIDKLKSMLPDQALENSLHRSADDIAAYLEVLKESFVSL